MTSAPSAGAAAPASPRSRARATPPPAPRPPGALGLRRPLAGALGLAGRASRGGGGGAAHAHGLAARAERGAPRGCSHDGRGCVRSGQSRGRLRPLHPGPAAAHHPARRVLGKDGWVAQPSRGWGGVGARARAARPDGPQPHPACCPGAAAGGEPSGWRTGARPSLLPGLRAGVPAFAGAPAPRPLASRCPHFLLSPPPPIAVTSRPRPGASRFGLRAAAWADRRPWGRNPGFRWPFFGGGSGRGSFRGVHALLPWTIKEERAGNRVFVA